MQLRARSGVLASCVLVASALALAKAPAARAEALPGSVDIFVGGHALVLAAESCERDGDVEACQVGRFFAGFQLGGHAQVVPWFALGLRLSGSADLDGSMTVGSEGFEDRDAWLWRAAVRARFDPPLWPRALWLAAELGVAVAVEMIDRQIIDRIQSTSGSSAGFLAGLAVGWELDVHEGFVLGVELQCQYVAIAPVTFASERGTRDEEAPKFPYISVGLHGGYRW